jgi:hypothetical protein
MGNVTSSCAIADFGATAIACASSVAVQKFALLGGQVGSELLNQSHTTKL